MNSVKCSKCEGLNQYDEMIIVRTAKAYYFDGKRIQIGKECCKCGLERQRIQRKSSGNKIIKKYEKTPKGFLTRLYRNMKSRVEGVQKAKYHLYKNKYLLPKEEFIEWTLKQPNFMKLFNDYKISGFERKLAPSVDRIDSSIGYEISNMEWVTMSENSRRSSDTRKKK